MLILAFDAITGIGAGAALLSDLASLVVELPNSRRNESEADAIGVELTARACYDPAGLARALEVRTLAPFAKVPRSAIKLRSFSRARRKRGAGWIGAQLVVRVGFHRASYVHALQARNVDPNVSISIGLRAVLRCGVCNGVILLQRSTFEASRTSLSNLCQPVSILHMSVDI